MHSLSEITINALYSILSQAEITGRIPASYTIVLSAIKFNRSGIVNQKVTEYYQHRIRNNGQFTVPNTSIALGFPYTFNFYLN